MADSIHEKQTDYIGGFLYEVDQLQQVEHGEGMVRAMRPTIWRMAAQLPG